MVSTLYFPDPTSHSSPHPMYRMTRTDDPGSEWKLTISNTTRIHKGRSTVYSALLSAKGFESFDVVCKVVFGKRAIARLRNEAEIYFKLRRLQGEVIPLCYGLFEGELEDGPSACLVTQHCGNTLDTELEYMDRTFRRKVIEAYVKIHAYGVQHHDFKECNIVVDDDSNPFIIDFELAERHECHRPKKLQMGVTQPFRDDFRCNEIYNVFSACNVWKPHLVPYLDGYVHVRYLESPEILAKMARGTVPIEKALEQARLTIQAYVQQWGKWVPPEYDYLGEGSDSDHV